MKTFIILLRGINVGGSGKLPMADLRAHLAALGAQGIETYIQSGNAVFRGEFETCDLASRIEDRIATVHGFRPAALVIPADRFAAIRAGFPFPAAQAEPKTGHIWFLAGPAHPDAVAIAALAAPDEHWRLSKHAFYLHAPAGIGRSKLAARIERLLGVPATARNLNTVNRLVAMGRPG